MAEFLTLIKRWHVSIHVVILFFPLQAKVEKQGIGALDTTLSFDEIKVVNENIEYLTKSLGVSR